MEGPQVVDIKTRPIKLTLGDKSKQLILELMAELGRIPENSQDMQILAEAAATVSNEEEEEDQEEDAEEEREDDENDIQQLQVQVRIRVYIADIKHMPL